MKTECCKCCGQELPLKRAKTPRKFDKVYASNDRKTWFVLKEYEYIGRMGGDPKSHCCNIDSDLSIICKHVRLVDDPRRNKWRMVSNANEDHGIIEAVYGNHTLKEAVTRFREEYKRPFFCFHAEKI